MNSFCKLGFLLIFTHVSLFNPMDNNISRALNSAYLNVILTYYSLVVSSFLTLSPFLTDFKKEGFSIPPCIFLRVWWLRNLWTDFDDSLFYTTTVNSGLKFTKSTNEIEETVVRHSLLMRTIKTILLNGMTRTHGIILDCLGGVVVVYANSMLEASG